MQIKPKNTSQGFSLIELLVAVSIITIISAIALFNQAKFSSDILITNMAYELALTIRQAEVFGISSKGTSVESVISSEQYRVGYGVHFTTAEPGSLHTFLDKPRGPASAPGQDVEFDFQYDANTDPLMTTIDLTQGEKIRRFCVRDMASAWHCSDEGSASTLDIVFVKPNPDAFLSFYHTTEQSCHYTDNVPSCIYDQAKIVIESGLGDKCRTVRVWITGQISVDPIDSSDTTA